MNDEVDIRATWPLGLSFTDHEGREFDVVKTVFGDPHAELQYIVECGENWIIQSEFGNHQQTMLGFVERGSDKLIEQLVSEMDKHLKNGYLKWL